MCHITRMPNLSLERFGLCVRNFCLGADMHSRTSVLVHTQISYKPKSDCIYHAPIDLKPSIGVRLVQNQLENGKYNLISKIFFYVGLCAREFFGQCPGRRGGKGVCVGTRRSYFKLGAASIFLIGCVREAEASRRILTPPLPEIRQWFEGIFRWVLSYARQSQDVRGVLGNPYFKSVRGFEGVFRGTLTLNLSVIWCSRGLRGPNPKSQT